MDVKQAYTIEESKKNLIQLKERKLYVIGIKVGISRGIQLKIYG